MTTEPTSYRKMLLGHSHGCSIGNLSSFPSAKTWHFQTKKTIRISSSMSMYFIPRENTLQINKHRVNNSRLSVNTRAASVEGSWQQWKKGASSNFQEVIGEKLFSSIAGCTAAPVAQFIPSPKTFLHSLDPRVKQAWLLALVVLPSRSHIGVRLGLVAFLSILSVCSLPRDIWQDQLVRTSILSGILFLTLALCTDGSPSMIQNRTPPAHTLQLPSIPKSLKGYSYVLMKIGPLQFTRKGLKLATTASCLSFILLQSASLCLATTTPEHLAAALRWFLLPLVNIGVPVDEIILTLLLSLRFISLVFDEVRNIALGIVARGIQWKNLTILETVDIFGLYVRRIFNNLFIHAENISQAMIARGFNGDPSRHKIYFLAKFSVQKQDIAALSFLFGLMILAFISELYTV